MAVYSPTIDTHAQRHNSGAMTPFNTSARNIHTVHTALLSNVVKLVIKTLRGCPVFDLQFNFTRSIVTCPTCFKMSGWASARYWFKKSAIADNKYLVTIDDDLLHVRNTFNRVDGLTRRSVQYREWRRSTQADKYLVVNSDQLARQMRRSIFEFPHATVPLGNGPLPENRAVKCITGN